MQFSRILTVLAATIFISTSVANAENCTAQALYDVLQPVASGSNYSKCQTDSNYTLLSIATPSLSQTRRFCSSSACQSLLNSIKASDVLPDCEVVVGDHTRNLTDVVAIVSSKCASPPIQEKLDLQESAVDKHGADSKAQRISGHVATVLGHSAPMDEVGEVASVLLFLLRT